MGVHQGKSRWHSYLVLVYIIHILTYLLGTVPYIFTMGNRWEGYDFKGFFFLKPQTAVWKIAMGFYLL